MGKRKILGIIGAFTLIVSLFAGGAQPPPAPIKGSDIKSKPAPIREDAESKTSLTGGAWYNLDCNYVDHGLVNINGNKVTTKKYTFLPESWQDGAKRAISHGGRGVIIDNYLFDLDTNGNFIVKDTNSGVVKGFDQKITNLQIVGNDPVYTVLKGFGYYGGGTYYSLQVYRVYDNIGWVDFYTFSPEAAFNKAEDNIKLTKWGNWKPWSDASQSEYKIISLIRVPALFPPVKDPGNLANSDFSIALIYYGGQPSRIYYTTFVWNQGFHYDNLNDRYFEYAPYVEYNYRTSTWDVMFKGYVRNIDAVSATTYIGENGRYEALLGINCWGKLKSSGLKGDEPFAAIKMVPFVVDYYNDWGGYFKLRKTVNSWDYTLVNAHDTFSEGHYAVVGTWAESTGSDWAKQCYGFVSPFDRSDPKFYKRSWSESYYTWNEAILAKHNVNSIQVDTSVINMAAHDGVIVSGMVLGVPPHPELYNNKIASSVELSNSIKTGDWNGVKTTVENSTTVEAGGCTPIVPFAASASYTWTGEQSSKDWNSFETGASYKIDSYNENLIVAVKPVWEIKSAIIKGNNGQNVRYGNQSETDKAYLVTTAVMNPKESGIIQIISDTMRPGTSIQGKEIVPTKGMAAYSASKLSDKDGALYDNYLKICKNLAELSKKGIISEITTTNSFLTSNSDMKTWFNIEKGRDLSRSTTNKYSFKLKAGVKDIATISNETTAKVEKSSGSSISSKDGSSFAYQYKGAKKDVSDNMQVKPVMYWIGVSALKAKYPSRNTADADLTFIPDYMWNNSMDYWLIAYRNIEVIHAPKK